MYPFLIFVYLFLINRFAITTTMGIVDSYAIIIYIVMFFTELKAVPCHKYGVCRNDLLIWIYTPLNNTNIPYYFSN